MISLLIADDNTDFAYNLSNLLANEKDMKIIGMCSNGLDTLATYNERHPDVLILDLNMPGLSGLDVLRILDENEESEANVIVISGSNEYRASIIYASKVRYILSKPYEPCELLEKIREIKKSLSNDNNLDKNINELLFTFNFNLDSKGTKFLCDSIKIAYKEPFYLYKVDNLINKVAKLNKPNNVKTIRSVIDKSINSMYSHQKNLDIFYNTFPDFDGYKPTIKSFVRNSVIYLNNKNDID